MAEPRLNSWLRAGGVPERARYESINSIFRVAGLKLVRPSVRALGTKGAMALALGLYAAQVRRHGVHLIWLAAFVAVLGLADA